MSSKNKRCQYSKEDMQNVLASVNAGMSVKAASEKYKVPRSTLTARKDGKYADKKPGPATILSNYGESILEHWILDRSRIAVPVTKEQLLNSVREMVSCRDNPFNNNKPGRNWYRGFMNRHRQLSVRVFENLTYSRAKVSENNIRGRFNEINNYLTLNNIKDLAPTRIFNADETALLLNPKNNTAIVKKGSKVVYNRVNNNEKESITTLITGNAAGQIAPSLMLFQYQRIPGYITRKFPKGWGIGISNNGWMTGQNFFEYIANILHPRLIQMNIELPITLYIDGHASHLTQPLTMFCMEHKIILITLHPNCTHILQPLDVSVFKPLKSEYVKVAEKYKIENNQLSVQKEDIANLSYKTLNNLNVKDIFRNGFQRCGLCPFNVNAVDYSKVITLKRRNVETIEQYSEQYKNALECIEKNITQDTLDSFKKQKSKNWTGKIEDKNLFELWSKLTKTNCDETEIDNIVQEVEFRNMSGNEEEIPILEETDAGMNMEEGDPLRYPLILCDKKIVMYQMKTVIEVQ